MPQMSPLSWMTLFTSFNTILMICLIKTWFSTTMFALENKKCSGKTNFTEIVWKW